MDIETLAPSIVRQPLIVLALANPNAQPQAFRAVDLTVTLIGQALVSGISLPVEFSVTGPSSQLTGAPVFTHVFRRTLPNIVTFVPKEGGAHGILLRELCHQRWWGALQIQVLGDPLFVPA